MVELHVDQTTMFLPAFGPTFEHGHVDFVPEGDIAGLAEGVAIDHDVAGDRQTDASPGPAFVENGHGFGNAVVRARQGFAHGGLHEAVGNHLAVGKGKGLGEGVGAGHRIARGAMRWPVVLWTAVLWTAVPWTAVLGWSAVEDAFDRRGVSSETLHRVSCFSKLTRP